MDIRDRGDKVEIPLTRGHKAIIDAVDYDLVSQYKWFADVRKNGKVYAAATVYKNGGKTSLRMHALILGTAGNGFSKVGEHKNNNGLDNTRENIRTASQLENMHNVGPGAERKFRGVTRQKRLTKRPWQARIHRNGSTLHLGYFPSEEEAASAYNMAASMSDGDFLILNKIPSQIEASDNMLRSVISRNKGLDDCGKNILNFGLSCGHMFSLPWWRRSKIGSTHHCKSCGGAGTLA